MTFPVCPCDDDVPAVPTNLPQQSRIKFRFGAYAEFRRAVLTPVAGEKSLTAWRTQGQGDLAVMMAEWFAYLGDILTFYDERIANQAYLRTADLDASVKRLIAVLGYRPRPAIGASGVLAALVTPGQSAVLPRGLQFQSKPGPGHPPQTFELSADTLIGGPDRVSATTPPLLLAAFQDFQYANLSIGLQFEAPARRHAAYRVKSGFHLVKGITSSANYGLLLSGAVATVDPGTHLALRPRDPAIGPPLLATVTQAVVQPSPHGGQQTALALAIDGTPPTGLAAAQAVLEKTNQSASLWTLFDIKPSHAAIHLASLVRQIRPGAWILIADTSVSPGFSPFLAQVTFAGEAVWDGTGSTAHPEYPNTAAKIPLPLPHTVLSVATAGAINWPASGASMTVYFDWIGVGRLLDQPPGVWSGTPGALIAASATRFQKSAGGLVLLQDAIGAGMTATAASAGDLNVALSALPAPASSLQLPFDVLYNPLPVTRGKTVSKEVLGSGDATRPDQTFVLAQSPVTYLEHGATWASTIALTVGGEPWTEVASFYGQAPDAQIFVTREDVGGQTHVDFGDGVNGARLPSGVNNVVATYRIGAGAYSPPAGKLTVIAQAFPGLRAVLNPVAVGGGADADPANQIRRYAPRSVLTFGRAVSVFDYEALAAQAPGVSRARALWAWSDFLQRTSVLVYVGDDKPAADSARAVLKAAGDPNRPVQVAQATPLVVTLTLTLLIKPGWDEDKITAQVTAALTDADAGLFGVNALRIGQPLFDSQIEAAVLAVAGTVAITAADFEADDVSDLGPLHNPGEGGFYTLDPADITLTLKADSHGG